MSTERIYYDDAYKRKITVKITDVFFEDDKTIFKADRTILFPGGGGQPSDTGSLLLTNGTEYAITDVYDYSLDGDIFHVTDKTDAITAGIKAIMQLDWENRFINMQRHTGEHILTAAFYHLFGAANKGFHMGSSFITIDIDAKGKMFSRSELELIEDTANKAIYANLPIATYWFDDAESASLTIPTRKKIDIKGRVSVVEIGYSRGYAEQNNEDSEIAFYPFDSVACCGTHLAKTGEVGIIKIIKSEPNKGMNRIYFECGIRALHLFRHELNVLRAVTDKFSSGSDEILLKLEKKDEQEKKIRHDLSILTEYVYKNEKNKMLSLLRSNHRNAISLDISVLPLNYTLKLGFDLSAAASDKLLLLKHLPSLTVLLFSGNEHDCAEQIKKYAVPFGGRGGGRKDNARVIFRKLADLDAFVDQVLQNI